MGMKQQDVQTKIKDFTIFGHINLALSVFMYLSLLIPPYESTNILYRLVSILGAFLFIGLAFIFYQKVLRLNRASEE